MRGLIVTFSLLLVLPLAGLAFLLALASSPAPQPAELRALGVDDLIRARQLWHTARPRGLQEGETRMVQIAARDLDLAANYVAQRMGLAGGAARIQDDRLIFNATLPLPALPRARYLNLSLTLAPERERLRAVELRAGQLPLPAPAAMRLAGWGLALSPLATPYLLLRDLLASARLQDDRLILTYVWREQSWQQAMQQGLGLDVAALAAYREALTGIEAREFAPYLGRVMALAQQRSRRHDPVRENRAALAALAELTLGARFGGDGPRVPRRDVLLGGRRDFAQHFALSAFLAATGGERLADLVGLTKEVDDAAGGSGFSFNDLAADRAGSRLGELATRSAADARRVQAKLAGSTTAQDYFPPMDGLPQFLSAAEFQRRFGQIGSPAYQELAAEIEARIDALALFQANTGIR